jgi:glyoxylase-like metal-dependent hydrolase (beta-lactamase superfamily II)/8-oxo-dGTP pyrophosphatase MutT (NUDIX family)
MSEALPGVPRATPSAATPRDAAVAILIRRTPEGPELFWLKREKRLRFAGGFYAFPGGGVDPGDVAVPVMGAEGADAPLVVAAARELLEETGILVAAGAERLASSELSAMRRALIDETQTFQQLLAERGLRIQREDFREAGRWITPAFMPIRFDARFFLVEAPDYAQPEIWPGESSEGGWIRPKDALDQWAKGTALLHPPSLHALRVFDSFNTLERALEELRNPPYCSGHVPSRIEFQRGIHLFPLETATLPPATHTNAYVLGNGELLIVDPGSPEVRECARLLALISGFVAEGRRPKAVFLTHHHADHIGGALALKERLKIPLWCHERTADRLAHGAADRLLVDGEVVQLQGAPAMRFRVLHTPGHARGHLCLVDEATSAAIAGDMVAGVGTIVIDPPEGDMAEYIAQLARLRDLPVTTLYPAHGPAIPDGPRKLDEYILHRQQRERLVLEAVAQGAATLREVVAHAYRDTAVAMHPVAERSAQAILIKLAREGKVARKDDRYSVG